MRVHNHYRLNAPANRDIIENFLMEEFHWTPMEISEIPYKAIQKMFLIRSQRSEVKKIQENIAKVKSSNMPIGSNKGSKRTYREV